MDSPVKPKYSFVEDKSKSDDKKDKTGTSSLYTSIFNLSKTIVGNGILSLPSAVAIFSDSPQSVIPACVLLVFMGYLADYSFISIGKICLRFEADSFTTAWARSTDCSGTLIAAVVTANTFLSCLASSIIIGSRRIFMYFLKHNFMCDVFIGDSGASLFKYYGIEVLSSRATVIVMCFAFILFPLCMLRKLDALKYTSLLGIIGSIFCAGFIVLRYIDSSYNQGGRFHNAVDDGLRPQFGNTLSVRTVFVFSFCCLSHSDTK